MAYFIKLGERRLITLNNEIEQGIGLNLIFWGAWANAQKRVSAPEVGGRVPGAATKESLKTGPDFYGKQSWAGWPKAYPVTWPRNYIKF